MRAVLAGEGEIRTRLDDGEEQTVAVSGTPRSYRLVGATDPRSGTLEVTIPEGVRIYSFTFG